MLKLGAVLLLFFGTPFDLSAQVSSDDAPVEVGPGVTPPKPVFTPEPSYSAAARENQIQGTVLLSIVVDANGRTDDINVISPLGYGLDEQAEATVERWRFTPAKKNGKAVKMRATVEVSFRLQGVSFNNKTERQRTSYNSALNTLRDASRSPKELENAVKQMHDLSGQGYPPAMYVYGSFEIEGQRVPKDVRAGLELIEKAASKNIAPALYALGSRQIDGRDVPQDAAKGFAALRKAATYGSAEAQRELGDRYETGAGVEADHAQAIRYFRLCATAGKPECQLHVGKLLLADKREGDSKEQAIAWLQVAGENGIAEASELAAAEIGKLTPAQINTVKRLEARFSRK